MIPPEDKRRVIGDVIYIGEVCVKFDEVIVVEFPKPGVEFSDPCQMAAVGSFADVQ